MAEKDKIRPTKLEIVLISIMFAGTLFAGFLTLMIFVTALK